MYLNMAHQKRYDHLLLQSWWLLKEPIVVLLEGSSKSCLTSESVQGASLPLESIDHIHGGDGLPLGVLSVGDRVPDHILQEDLKNTSRLLVDQSRDSLDASPSRQPSDGKLGTALDVIPQDLAMPLGATLPKALAALSSPSHGEDEM